MSCSGSCYYIMGAYNAFLSAFEMMDVDDYNIIVYELDRFDTVNVIHALSFTANQAAKLGCVGGSVSASVTLRDLTVINNHNAAPFNLEF
jgi:hypothetical protein